jgi:hypothetical protein
MQSHDAVLAKMAWRVDSLSALAAYLAVHSHQ